MANLSGKIVTLRLVQGMPHLLLLQENEHGHLLVLRVGHREPLHRDHSGAAIVQFTMDLEVPRLPGEVRQQ